MKNIFAYLISIYFLVSCNTDGNAVCKRYKQAVKRSAVTGLYIIMDDPMLTDQQKLMVLYSYRELQESSKEKCGSN